MLTRRNACDTLTKYLGRDLRPLAEQHGVTVMAENGNINKGWKGLACEVLAGITPNNRKAPNGLGFEMKSVAYYLKNGLWMPKETMAITMVKPEDFIKDEFLKSHLWEKLKSLIFCVVSWHGRNNPMSRLLKVTALDFLEDDNLIKEIEKDYEFIRNKLKMQGFKSLTSRDGKYVQARTKGAGHGSTSRAFYARKNFLEAICPSFKALTDKAVLTGIL
jgi:DNA mismatch repair protein MutH